MQIVAEERQRWRREHVNRFLAEIGLERDRLAASTLKCLDEWARQVKLVEDQPSSNFGNAVIQLCRAIESELAAGLGTLEALAFLRNGTLGQKAKILDSMKLNQLVSQRLASRGTKPGFVKSDLPRLLFSLARLRSDTDAAHGNAEIQSANGRDAARARMLAGAILKGIAAHAKRSR